jgi:hypothetical protein
VRPCHPWPSPLPAPPPPPIILRFSKLPVVRRFAPAIVGDRKRGKPRYLLYFSFPEIPIEDFRCTKIILSSVSI